MLSNHYKTHSESYLYHHRSVSLDILFGVYDPWLVGLPVSQPSLMPPNSDKGLKRTQAWWWWCLCFIPPPAGPHSPGPGGLLPGLQVSAHLHHPGGSPSHCSLHTSCSWTPYPGDRHAVLVLHRMRAHTIILFIHPLLVSAGRPRNLWELLQEAEEKTGPAGSAAASQHGESRLPSAVLSAVCRAGLGSILIPAACTTHVEHYNMSLCGVGSQAAALSVLALLQMYKLRPFIGAKNE